MVPEASKLEEMLPDDRQKVVALVRKWGGMNSDGILDLSCKFFLLPEIEGMIGYRVESGHAIVFGEPLCSHTDKAKISKAFQNHCEAQKWGVVYTMVSKSFADWSLENLSCVSVEFGEKFILNPLINPLDSPGPNGVLVRKKVRQAHKNKIYIQEYLKPDPSIEAKIEKAAELWLQARKGPQIYLSQIRLFHDKKGKRWFYAQHEDNIVGLLVLNQIQDGWLLNNVMTTKEAPSGTSELLIISALETLGRENCKNVIVGPIPAQYLGEINGVNFLLKACTRFLYQCAKKLFRLEGYETFWKKFQPSTEGCYIVFPRRNLSFSSIKGVLQAFNVKKK